ncbi:hypothetical protein I6F35_33485 [Bradyrhizobium sp. BRP22]|uniref:hypothetical protein n=1 Tax=Bradyrhizobium sp. BRP22 TaxID=2793821 RepID=UPI001CD7EBE7|nr:hypothetical protein [Bradyrhizobium sp. BRP22]MCA1458048.1 hypothetical protein [Bradyrhizobium sp. BRP22]
MPFKDPEIARAYRRDRRRNERIELRDLRRAMSLHQRLGIETQVYRVPVLDDHRMGRRFDRQSRCWNHQHPYRESITLARV